VERRVVIGGTSIINFKSFLADLVNLKDMNRGGGGNKKMMSFEIE
jgi:hypothetical protein